MKILFNRSALLAYLFIVSIMLWSWLLLTVGPEAVLSWIGAENGYWVMFLVALLGGMSSIGGITYVATIITLASAGLNPAGLALASGLAISIGDTIYYYIGRHGLRILAHGRLQDRIQQVSHWLHNRSRVVLFSVVYGYTAFTPLPNDLLTLTLGITKQPWRTCITALTLGNMTLTYIIAVFGNKISFLF
ncbi:MAG: membrane protein YqaA with SNARE-associated domain [Patiriisocius sp.]|jgi:membrane protein YqaA with SNARE-associated domain